VRPHPVGYIPTVASNTGKAGGTPGGDSGAATQQMSDAEHLELIDEWSRPDGVVSFDSGGLGRRKAPRYSIEVPIVYASDTLTIEATTSDVSAGGTFVVTELLDAVGTPCALTALPAGQRPMVFHGVVARVATRVSPEHPPGIGVKFVGGARCAMRWLDQVIEGHTRVAHGSAPRPGTEPPPL